MAKTYRCGACNEDVPKRQRAAHEVSASHLANMSGGGSGTRGLSSEGLSSEGLSSEGLSSEGLSSEGSGTEGFSSE